MSAAQKAIVNGHATNNTAKLVAAEGGLTALETARGNLETAIAAATENKDSVVVDIDAANVYKGKQWVLENDKSTYEAAITTAQGVADATDKKIADVTGAISTLGTATETFEGQVKTAPAP